jgi:hypothetical protein
MGTGYAPDGLSDKFGTVANAVVRSNFVKGGNCIEIANGTNKARVSNNSVDRGNSGLSAIEVKGADPAYIGRHSTELVIEDNELVVADVSKAPPVVAHSGEVPFMGKGNVAISRPPAGGNP